MQSLKRKMNLVKEAGKQCKLFFMHHEKQNGKMSAEETKKLKELFSEHMWTTKQCLHILKKEELQSYISNCD